MNYKLISDDELLAWFNRMRYHMSRASLAAKAMEDHEKALRERMSVTRGYPDETSKLIALAEDVTLKKHEGSWSYHMREVTRYSAAIQGEAAMRAMAPLPNNPLNHPSFKQRTGS